MWVHCCCLQTHPKRAFDPHYIWLWATIWLLGIELRTSGRAVSALNCWAILWAQPTLFLQYRHLDNDDNDDSSFYLRLLVYRQLSQYLEGQSSSRHLSLRVWNWLDPVSKMGSWIGELPAAVSWKCKTPAQGKVLSILGKRLPSYTQWRQCLPGIAESNLLLIIPPGTPGADFPLWLDSGYCQVLDPFWPSQSPLTLTWVIFNLAGVSFLYLLSWWDCSLTQEYKNTFRSQIIVCVCVCVCVYV